MSVPTAPLSLTILNNERGLVTYTWATPSSDGGPNITTYDVQTASNSGFTTDVFDDDVPASRHSYTATVVVPGSTLYFRVRARNSDGAGAWATASAAVQPAATALDNIQAAAVVLADGTRVELRVATAGTTTWPTFSIGYTTATSSTYNILGSVPTGPGLGEYIAPHGGERALALVADPAGNLYLIGRRQDHYSTVMMYRYTRTGPTTWNPTPDVSQQSIGHTGERLRAFAATWVSGAFNGAGAIFLMVRRSGPQGAGALSYGLINPAYGPGSTLFASFGSDPSWLPTPPSSALVDVGSVDVVALTSNRVAILANGNAVVDISTSSFSGVGSSMFTGVSKDPGGTYISGQWLRNLAINASTTVSIAEIGSGDLRLIVKSATGSTLATYNFSNSLVWGGGWGSDWSAYYDRAAGLVRVYYLSAASSTAVHMLTYSPTTFTATVVGLVATMPTGGTGTNTEVRVPVGVVDERRVAVQVSNNNAGVHTLSTLYTTAGNKAPNAPSVTDVTAFDALQAYTFSWAPSDPNPFDTTQNGGTLRIERVSDSVEVYTTTLTAGQTSKVLPAATLTNGVSYRWQVRTTDVLGAVGAFSAFDTFTTVAMGTLTITSPAADNPAGLEVSSLAITWTYTQPSGYTQTQRRVRVLRVSDSAVLSDTTMQASTATTHTVTGLPSGEPVSIELSVVTTAPGTPTVTTTRLLTTNYDQPMTPVLDAVADPASTFVLLSVTNPIPTGDRPETVLNIIERRTAGSSDDFAAIGSTENGGTFSDYTTASAGMYEYRVRGISE